MWFFLFVMSVAINCTFTIYFACYCIAIEGFGLLYMLGLMEAITFCCFGWILTCTSVINLKASCYIIQIINNFFVTGDILYKKIYLQLTAPELDVWFEPFQWKHALAMCTVASCFFGTLIKAFSE